MSEHKLKSSLDSLVPYEVAEAQRAVQFLESLLRKEEKATSPLVSKAATAALLAASELVEANGVKLSFSPGGITWRLEKALVVEEKSAGEESLAKEVP